MFVIVVMCYCLFYVLLVMLCVMMCYWCYVLLYILCYCMFYVIGVMCYCMFYVIGVMCYCMFYVIGYVMCYDVLWCVMIVLFVICYLLFVICYLLFVICYLLFVICYLLLVLCNYLRLLECVNNTNRVFGLVIRRGPNTVLYFLTMIMPSPFLLALSCCVDAKTRFVSWYLILMCCCCCCCCCCLFVSIVAMWKQGRKQPILVLCGLIDACKVLESKKIEAPLPDIKLQHNNMYYVHYIECKIQMHNTNTTYTIHTIHSTTIHTIHSTTHTTHTNKDSPTSLQLRIGAIDPSVHHIYNWQAHTLLKRLANQVIFEVCIATMHAFGCC